MVSTAGVIKIFSYELSGTPTTQPNGCNIIEFFRVDRPTADTGTL